jgi:hypothetical protein
MQGCKKAYSSFSFSGSLGKNHQVQLDHQNHPKIGHPWLGSWFKWFMDGVGALVPAH